jgi:hypothetical protein
VWTLRDPRGARFGDELGPKEHAGEGQDRRDDAIADQRDLLRKYVNPDVDQSAAAFCAV